MAAIAALNLRHGPGPGGHPRFMLLHRRRVFNAGENRWMGWERKRGKLHELNRLLRGATDTTFEPGPDGPPRMPPDVRYVITLDADLQNPPEEIPGLVQVAAQGYDVVGTVRQLRQDSALRRVASRLINRAVLRSTGVAMTDYGCMLRAYRRNVVDAMLECRERSTFIPILANCFARHTCEVPVRHAAREHGGSRYGFMKLVNLMFDLVTTMSTTPLRVLSLFGGALALTGFAFGLLLLVLRLAQGPEWAAQGVFVLFAVLFIFTGAQFIGLGLLGEYLGRVYHDVRARPRFFVERIVRAPAPATSKVAPHLHQVGPS